LVRCLVSLSLMICVASCAPAPLVPIGQQHSFNAEKDEKRLWNRSEEEQARLGASGHIYEDPDLAAYVNEVARKLVPERVQDDMVRFKIKMVKNPLLNAFAYPNGAIYIHTGILTRMENEAQLAALLGHEMTHVTHRHAVLGFRNLQKKTAIMATLQVAAIPFGVYGSVATLLGTVGGMAAISGYSQEMESEADRVGMAMMVKAGYDPSEAPRLFEHIKRDIEEYKIKEPFFFGSHPKINDRIESFSHILESEYSGQKNGKDEVERFAEKVQPLLLDNAFMDMSLGRYGPAQRAVERFLRREPRSARGHFALGEVFRQNNGAGDMDRAEQEYKLALEYSPSYPEPYRTLGILYYKQSRWKESERMLDKYLSLAPSAPDKGYVEQYLEEIKAKTGGGG